MKAVVVSPLEEVQALFAKLKDKLADAVGELEQAHEWLRELFDEWDEEFAGVKGAEKFRAALGRLQGRALDQISAAADVVESAGEIYKDLDFYLAKLKRGQ